MELDNHDVFSFLKNIKTDLDHKFKNIDEKFENIDEKFKNIDEKI